MAHAVGSVLKLARLSRAELCSMVVLGSTNHSTLHLQSWPSFRHVQGQLVVDMNSSMTEAFSSIHLRRHFFLESPEDPYLEGQLRRARSWRARKRHRAEARMIGQGMSFVRVQCLDTPSNLIVCVLPAFTVDEIGVLTLCRVVVGEKDMSKSMERSQAGEGPWRVTTQCWRTPQR